MELFELGRYKGTIGLENESGWWIVVVGREELSQAQIEPTTFKESLHFGSNASLFDVYFDCQRLHVFGVFVEEFAVDALQGINELA